jgi:threonine dehydrogenase-like Zn-dependent dehydrogenase
MKAALLVAPQKYEVREVPDPTAPPDGVVLRVGACGVCGSDLRRWREGPPAGTDAVIGGHEIAGEVIEVGERLHVIKWVTTWRLPQMCTAEPVITANAAGSTCVITCGFSG